MMKQGSVRKGQKTVVIIDGYGITKEEMERVKAKALTHLREGGESELWEITYHGKGDWDIVTDLFSHSPKSWAIASL